MSAERRKLWKALPLPFMKGKFAIFETPDGGLHIAYRLDGDRRGETCRASGRNGENGKHGCEW